MSSSSPSATVTGTIAKTDGAIGYVDYSDAKAAAQVPDQLRQTMEAAGQRAALDRIRERLELQLALELLRAGSSRSTSPATCR